MSATRSVHVVGVALAMVVTPSFARANGPEDQLGLGARVAAMGGAGTALAVDATATYYNPGGLAFCPDSQAMIEARHTAYALRTRRLAVDPALGDPTPVPDQTRVTLAWCLRLPRHVALGVLFGAGLQSMAAVSQPTPDARPRLGAYGGSLEQLSIGLGLAYRPIPELSVGIGGAVIIRSSFRLGAEIPILQLDPVTGQLIPVEFDLAWRIRPTGAPYVGVLVAPIPSLKIGATYRGRIAHHLEGPLDIHAMYGSVSLPLPIRIASDSWYSPRQVAIGASFSPIETVTLAADLTWYQYRDLRSSPYPFLEITGSRALLEYPVLDPLGWKNVWAPRVGGELRLARDRVALRAGYGFRTAMLSLPGSRNTTVLDGAVHGVSIGAGYVHDFPRRGRSGSDAAPASRRRARAGYEATGWRDDVRPNLRVRIDLFARLSVMPEQRDETKALAFGGRFYDAGITTSLGWY